MRNIFVILLAISSSCLFACGDQFFWNEPSATDVERTVALVIASLPKTQNVNQNSDQEEFLEKLISTSPEIKTSFFKIMQKMKEKEKNNK